MESTKRRMIVVAVLVCGFAVGMAGLLNYFKYRSTALSIVHERLLVTGRSVENAIQSSLLLGLQFGDIGTLPGTLERERATDDLILGIDIFDMDGRMLYSTDRLRASRPVPGGWLAAAKRAGSGQWIADGTSESAVGISINNNFGLTIGYLALRYSNERVQRSAYQVGRELAVASLGIFAVAATLSSLALLGVMKRLSRDVAGVEAALRSGDPARATVAARGPFAPSLKRFVVTVRDAETAIADIRGRLQRGPVA